MKFSFTPRFLRDLKEELDADELRAVKDAKETLKLALQGNVQYFNKHHIKQMVGHPNIWEGHVKDNLCFTFHYGKTESGEKIVFFRRVGTHTIYMKP